MIEGHWTYLAFSHFFHLAGWDVPSGGPVTSVIIQVFCVMVIRSSVRILFVFFNPIFVWSWPVTHTWHGCCCNCSDLTQWRTPILIFCCRIVSSKSDTFTVLNEKCELWQHSQRTLGLPIDDYSGYCALIFITLICNSPHSCAEKRVAGNWKTC